MLLLQTVLHLAVELNMDIGTSLVQPVSSELLGVLYPVIKIG